jgi:hypothetical protein
MNKQTRALVNEIRQALEARGVRVHVHPAVTTSSCYITLDNGVLKKIRVGDHKGRGYQYTYEIGPHVKPPFVVENEYQGHSYTRYRYTEGQVSALVHQVLSMRSNLRGKYGREAYQRYVENGGHQAQRARRSVSQA